MEHAPLSTFWTNTLLIDRQIIEIPKNFSWTPIWKCASGKLMDSTESPQDRACQESGIGSSTVLSRGSWLRVFWLFFLSSGVWQRLSLTGEPTFLGESWTYCDDMNQKRVLLLKCLPLVLLWLKWILVYGLYQYMLLLFNDLLPSQPSLLFPST